VSYGTSHVNEWVIIFLYRCFFNEEGTKIGIHSIWTKILQALKYKGCSVFLAMKFLKLHRVGAALAAPTELSCKSSVYNFL